MMGAVRTTTEAAADPQGGSVMSPSAPTSGLCSLIIDDVGIIRSCGEAAGRMLGSSFTELVGKPVSMFLPGFSLSESSSSYSSRYIQHLCNGGGCHVFEAVDVQGRRFTVELSLSRIATEGQGGYLLSLRRQDDPPCAGPTAEGGGSAS